MHAVLGPLAHELSYIYWILLFSGAFAKIIKSAISIPALSICHIDFPPNLTSSTSSSSAATHQAHGFYMLQIHDWIVQQLTGSNCIPGTSYRCTNKVSLYPCCYIPYSE